MQISSNAATAAIPPAAHPVPMAGHDRVSSAAAPATRHAWLDAAKGIGIALVVLGHALGGLMDVAGQPPRFGMQAAFFAIYTFHMPLFFFLSALLVPRRIARSPRRFADAIGKRVLYPYLLWSVIQITAIFAAGTLVNSPVGSFWPTILALPWHPVSQFWFLYVLALLQVASLAVLVAAPRHGRWILLAAAIVLRVVAAVEPGPGPLGQAMDFAVFYAAGLVLGTDGVGALRRASPTVVAAAVALFVAALAAAFSQSLLPLLAAQPDPASAALASSSWRLVAMPAALLGATVCLMLAMRLGGPVLRLLAMLGQASMAIYLTHVLVIAGTRIAVQHTVGLTDPLFLVPGLTLLGLGGGIVAHRLAARLKLGAWTGLE